VAGETLLSGEWDLPRIERVLDNLIGNAVKYSPDGGVVNVVCVRDDDETGDWAIISVAIMASEYRSPISIEFSSASTEPRTLAQSAEPASAWG
jgi:hypothetical protein